MEKRLKISIQDIELLELDFKKTTNKTSEVSAVNIEVDIKEKNEKENGYQVKVAFNADFNVTSRNLEINGKYLFLAVFAEIENLEEFNQMVEERKYEMSFPMLSKISSLITKITEEARPFPLIVPPVAWIEATEDEE
ncbi:MULTISPECIES: hypothetical protein [Rummeliibacillus]|uniref:hypothetical protein n=1 Tax=Rummeliibacillus TaxID=648802 RepID=UPI00123955D7|nr:hypothetical protein [Rummeliibacillus sp. TYF-LIM-RU47]